MLMKQVRRCQEVQIQALMTLHLNPLIQQPLSPKRTWLWAEEKATLTSELVRLSLCLSAQLTCWTVCSASEKLPFEFSWRQIKLPGLEQRCFWRGDAVICPSLLHRWRRRGVGRVIRAHRQPAVSAHQGWAQPPDRLAGQHFSWLKNITDWGRPPTSHALLSF